MTSKKSESDYFNIDENAQIFNELRDNPPHWWTEFKNRDDLYIEVRQGNKVHVYHEGGRVGEIVYRPRKAKLGVKTNSSYLGEGKGGSYIECSDRIADKLDVVIENIESIYSQRHPEEIIKGQLISNHRDIHLDSEYKFDDGRIDLVKVDDKGVITFVELKRFRDYRMLTSKVRDNKVRSKKDLPEIIDQMKKYKKFIDDNYDKILEYYKKLYKIKVKLGLLKSEQTACPKLVNREPELLIFNQLHKMSEGEVNRLAAIEKMLKEKGITYKITNEL